MDRLINRLSSVIRETLDSRGIEIAWSDTDDVAMAVIDELSTELGSDIYR